MSIKVDLEKLQKAIESAASRHPCGHKRRGKAKYAPCSICGKSYSQVIPFTASKP